MNFKVGDRVLLKNRIGYSWTNEMREYKGKAVTIKEMYKDSFHIVEDKDRIVINGYVLADRQIKELANKINEIIDKVNEQN